VLARRIGRLDYAVAMPSSRAASAEKQLPWVAYVEEMSGLPQAAWMEGRDGGTVSLAVNDAEAVIAAIAAGLGRALLPSGLAPMRGIRLSGETVMSREIWLLVHEDLRRLARVRAVVEWIEEIVRARFARP
jgi:DNA-binding transcriptional LysR family regulator